MFSTSRTAMIKILAAAATSAILGTGALAQSVEGNQAASALAAVPNEAPPKLFVEAPLPAALARGAVLIPYRVENLRILPLLGADARMVSPRVGHLHVTVDDLPWRWGDFSNTNTIVVTGMPAGPHKILIELADPEHRIYASETVHFTVPGAAPAAGAPHAH